MEQNYTVIKHLGSGSMGTVYLVKENSTDAQYVMKKISLELLSDEERNRALNEIEILKKHCAHPNIIRYQESFLGNDKKTMNIIMEYANEGDLFQFIQSRIKKKGEKLIPHYFPEDFVIEMFIQICLSVKHLHNQNILHRDLKTQNIFVTKIKNAEKEIHFLKLGDFGISKFLNTTAEFAKTRIGTPFYLSPEVCEEKEYNTKSDIWALGCILYELTFFRTPFNGKTLPALFMKIINGSFEFPTKAATKYSQELKTLISETLQVNPDDRPSIDEILGLPFIQKHLSQWFTMMAPPQSQKQLKNDKKKLPNMVETQQLIQPINESVDGSATIMKKKWMNDKVEEMQSIMAQVNKGKKKNEKEDQKEEQKEEIEPQNRLEFLREQKKREKEREKMEKLSSQVNDLSSQVNQMQNINNSKSSHVRSSKQAQQQQQAPHIIDFNPEKLIIRSNEANSPVIYNPIEQKPDIYINLQQNNAKVPKSKPAIAKNPKIAPKSSKAGAKPKKQIVYSQSGEEMSERDIKNQQVREQFLKEAQEKREKRKSEKELAERQMKEHKMKMKNIRASHDWRKMLGKNEENAESTPKDEEKPEIEEKIEEIEEIDEEKEQKEKEIKEKNERKSENFKNFIKQMKKQKKDEDSDEIKVDVVEKPEKDDKKPQNCVEILLPKSIFEQKPKIVVSNSISVVQESEKPKIDEKKKEIIEKKKPQGPRNSNAGFFAQERKKFKKNNPGNSSNDFQVEILVSEPKLHQNFQEKEPEDEERIEEEPEIEEQPKPKPQKSSPKLQIEEQPKLKPQKSSPKIQIDETKEQLKLKPQKSSPKIQIEEKKPQKTVQIESRPASAPSRTTIEKQNQQKREAVLDFLPNFDKKSSDISNFIEEQFLKIEEHYQSKKIEADKKLDEGKDSYLHILDEKLNKSNPKTNQNPETKKEESFKQFIRNNLNNVTPVQQISQQNFIPSQNGSSPFFEEQFSSLLESKDENFNENLNENVVFDDDENQNQNFGVILPELPKISPRKDNGDEEMNKKYEENIGRVLSFMLHQEKEVELKEAILKNEGKKDKNYTNFEKLSFRIEALREFCEKKMGTDVFLSVYRALKEQRDPDKSTGFSTREFSKLPSQSRDLETKKALLEKVNQMIFCEELFYGS